MTLGTNEKATDYPTAGCESPHPTLRLHQDKERLMRNGIAGRAGIVVVLTALFSAFGFVPGAGARAARVFIESPNGGQPVEVRGEYVRRGLSSDGVVVVGYRTANSSVGQEWMLLDVGMTAALGKAPVVKREDIRLILSDGEVLPLPSQETFQKAYPRLRGLEARANATPDSINYLPSYANIACRLGFFTDTTNIGRGMAYDQVSLNQAGACYGRLYFQIPGGIEEDAVYILAVQFPESDLQIPLNMLTKQELKEIKAQLKEADKLLKEEEKKQKKQAKEEKKAG